jgi:hypothetical protein
MRHRPMIKALALIASACSVPVGAQASNSDVRPEDYAYGATLQTGGAALYVVTLREDLYRYTIHPDLTDVCVINGLNEVVPFALRRPLLAQPVPEDFQALPLFPLSAADAKPGEALKLQLRTAGTSLVLEQPPHAGATSAAAYLLDERGSEEPVTALRLAWPADAPDFSARLLVESSDDLSHWHTIAGNVPIVSLHYGGQEFVRAEASLPELKSSFLRLSWSDAPAAITLTAVSARRRAAHVDAQRLTITAPGTATRAAGDYEFDLGANLPLDRVNLNLPELNSVVEAQFFARTEAAMSWQSVVRGRLYRLKISGGEDLTNAPLSIPLTSSRYWKVRIDAAGGGVGSGLPSLQGGWLPDELLFVARGPAPFQLLYGNAAAPSLAVSPNSLLDARLAPQSAILEAPRVLGGESRLHSPPLPTDWKRWVLWSVLIIGVSALGLMAWRLSHTLNDAPRNR